jgi:acyl carrier protein
MNIEEQVKQMIAEKLAIDPAGVTLESSFTNDLGADSLDTVELMMAFEKAFGVNIPDDETEKIVTVGDAINYIKEKMNN